MSWSTRRSYPAIDLAGSIVVVTGGARGIGRATATAFHRAGARVWIGDLDLDLATEVASGLGDRASARRLDVTSRESFEAFVADVLAENERIDVLVNNAGVMPLGAFIDEPDEVGRTTLDVNVWGTVLGMRLVLPGMVERGRGHVVNIASMAGKVPIAGMAVYNASKFGVVGMTAAVRQEVYSDGVSVSSILPSAVRTELVAGVPEGIGLPMVDPDDIAAAVLDSCRTRRAQTAIPRWTGIWDVAAALTPEPLMRTITRLANGDRALTSVDDAARSAYAARVRRQLKPRR